MKKIILLTLLALSIVFGANRIGPVSEYGELIAGAPNGKGDLYGSCKGVNTGAEVQVRGMSLYWSLLPDATEFWNADAIGTMVKEMKIEVIRAAMATGNEDWGADKGYGSDPNTQKNYVNAVVQAAIDNDIYVIIDWHSHEANNQVESAKNFFREMAQKWGSYDNVIFEIFNEPKQVEWSVVKNYAEQIVPVIRQYSDNLIVIGNPQWSATPNSAKNDKVSGENLAYTFHYYAGTHKTTSEGRNVTLAMNAGLTVFVTEWGTGTADGKGDANSFTNENSNWQTFLNNNKLSWANWSASKINEGTAAFNSGANRYSLSYSNSGNMLKGYLSSNKSSYTKCGGAITPPSSSSEQVDRISTKPKTQKPSLLRKVYNAMGRLLEKTNNWQPSYEK